MLSGAPSSSGLANLDSVNLLRSPDVDILVGGEMATCGVACLRFRVAHIGMFRPKWDPNVCDYLDVEVAKLKWVDVHGLVHYLESPSVHIPILRAACQITIDAAKEKKAIKTWEDSKGDNCPESLEVLKKKLQKLKADWDDKGDAFGPVEVAVLLVDVWRAIEDARVACGKP